mgnify:FL=1
MTVEEWPKKSLIDALKKEWAAKEKLVTERDQLRREVANLKSWLQYYKALVSTIRNATEIFMEVT